MVGRVFGLLGLSVLALVVGCTADTFAPGGELPGDSTGGTSADGGTTPTCASGQEPKDDPACVTETAGVFVSPNGDDQTGAGSRTAPLRTVGAALKMLDGRGTIFLCAGAYPEDVTMDASHAANLYGGFSCADWSYTGDASTLGAGPNPLTMTGTGGAHVFEDVSIVARDAGQPGQTSTAVALHDAGKVSFVGAHIEAGRGQDGAGGVPGSNYDPVASNDPSVVGSAASGVSGGTSKKCSCKDGTYSLGGAGGAKGTDGAKGSPADTVVQAGVDGAGGLFNLGNAQCGAGHTGAAGAVGKEGVAAPIVGGLDAQGKWAPQDGSAGQSGGVGQGGGGASGNYGYGGPGGSCGGCGGAGGGGGQGGGGSIGVLAAGETTLVVSGGEIVTHAGGHGGLGSNAQSGQVGGQAAGGICASGGGGHGGHGGTGAGGAGGVSVGVMYDVHAPEVTADVQVGAAGKGGFGGASDNGGADGVAKDVYQVESAAQ